MSAGLELSGVSKRYGAEQVVREVSLTVPEGELLVLVGPSGSGKSSLLRMIAGLVEHDGGQIRVGGREVGALPPDQRDIAMVFQSYALFPHLNVYENLAFGMRARREPRAQIESRITEVAAALGLGTMLERLPRQLSGGERQRVALARAMLRKPRLFLLDEPLSNLDAQLRVQTRAEILRLHRRLGTTMVYVTHDQIEALSMGDRIGVMRGGVLEDLGTPSEIYRQPRTLFVARFIGSPPMNTLAVDVTGPDTVSWQGRRVQMPTWAGLLGDTGRALTLGIRPEHVGLAGSRWAGAVARDWSFRATVTEVEFAGDQQFLRLDLDGTEVLARAEPELAAAPGTAVEGWFTPEALQLFDTDSGLALRGRTQCG